MHVLLIGAYKPLVKALKQGLEEERFAVDVAYDAAEAEAKLRTSAYSVIVFDLVHPREVGLALVRCWRRSGVRTPVLALTPPGNGSDRAGAHDAGANDMLTKPFGLEEILARLRAVVVSTDPLTPGTSCTREIVCVGDFPS
jgi:DNA-binding response OmpR family regulator